MVQEVPFGVRVSAGVGVRVLRLQGVIGESALGSLREASIELLRLGFPVRVDCREVIDLAPEALSMLVALKAGLALQDQPFSLVALAPELIRYVGEEAEALVGPHAAGAA